MKMKQLILQPKILLELKTPVAFAKQSGLFISFNHSLLISLKPSPLIPASWFSLNPVHHELCTSCARTAEKVRGYQGHSGTGRNRTPQESHPRRSNFPVV